ncbi:Ribbon-helix-helix protein CopG domain-containing protein, partial [Dysosmobacter welbionis]
MAGDHRLGPHAGFEELVKQVGGRRLHIAQLLEDGLQAGQHSLHAVRIRHPAAQHIGQQPREHIPGVGAHRVGGAHRHRTVELRQPQIRPGGTRLDLRHQTGHMHIVDPVPLRHQSPFLERLQNGTVGVEDDGGVEYDLALARRAVELLVVLQGGLAGGKEK